MKVYDSTKTIELEEYDLDLGHLENDTLTIHHKAVPFIERKVHYETIKEYPNGGKDVKEVVDVDGQQGKLAYDETEEILVYIPYTENELYEINVNNLRERRETECFHYINRGELWYKHLTEEQIAELDTWYEAWLDVTETMVVPDKPSWLV